MLSKQKLDVVVLGSDILRTEHFKRALCERHHIRSNVGVHSYHVAYVSLFLWDLVKKGAPGRQRTEFVKACLCHDMGIVGRYDGKFSFGRDVVAMHPVYSLEIAESILGQLSQMQEEVIALHMFPFCGYFPRTMETWIITLADKYCAVSEFLFGKRATYSAAGYLHNIPQMGEKFSKDAIQNGKEVSFFFKGLNKNK